MNEEIKQLTELQVIDLEIAKLDAEIDAGQAEVDMLGKAFEDRKGSIEEIKQKIEAAESRHRELEAEHADELGRIKDRQSKMMQVQTNREYQSLLKEIEDGKKANKSREDELVQIMESTETLTALIKEQEELCKKEEKALAGETKKLSSFSSKLNTKKAVIEKKRNGKIEGFSKNLLRKYNTLRERRNGRAVVGVINGVCQGCFMSIPPQQFNELLRGDQMLFCPTCQRIIYHQAENTKE